MRFNWFIVNFHFQFNPFVCYTQYGPSVGGRDGNISVYIGRAACNFMQMLNTHTHIYISILCIKKIIFYAAGNERKKNIIKPTTII